MGFSFRDEERGVDVGAEHTKEGFGKLREGLCLGLR